MNIQHQQQVDEARPAVDLGLLIDQLKLVIANPDAVSAGATDVQRYQVQQLARAAAVSLEDPFEILQRLVYSPLPLITARVSQENSIYAILAAAKEPIDFATIQDASKLESGVLESIMAYICTQGMAREVEPGRYSATKLTQLMMAPVFQDAITHFHDNCLPAFAALNSVLGNGSAAKQNAFKVGQHSEVDFYTWLDSHPVQKGAFHRFMEAQFASLPTWLDIVDLDSELAKGITAADAIFVDVGGGTGQQCAALKKKKPHLQGRIILQDKPEVLKKTLTVEGMEKMSYDYLTEQPVKGARVYYLRQIMHNNSDDTCMRILQFQIPAMGPDSVIIIDDKVLPDEKPPPGTPGIEYTAGLGLAMKVMFDAQERREGHWRRLLDSAGFEIRAIKKFTKFDDAAITIVPKTS